jgi:catechol 2,3-dioxygenase-like lactoylglutathione lyase family enzyme
MQSATITQQVTDDPKIRPETAGIHHIAIRCCHLTRSRRFYEGVLGFPVLLDLPNLFIVAAGNTAIAVRGPEDSTPAGDKFNPYRVGLDHIALACPDPNELTRVAGALREAHVENTGIKIDEVLGKKYVAFKDPDRIAWEFYAAFRLEDPRIAAVESYFAGLKKKDLSGIPFADDVTFESPLSPRVQGARLVTDFLRGVFPIVNNIRIHSHIVEGDRVGCRFDLETKFGTIPAFDYFRIVGGRITEVRPFYDPRPITSAAG